MPTVKASDYLKNRLTVKDGKLLGTSICLGFCDEADLIGFLTNDEPITVPDEYYNSMNYKLFFIPVVEEE